jgi:signal peptidase I
MFPSPHPPPKHRTVLARKKNSAASAAPDTRNVVAAAKGKSSPRISRGNVIWENVKSLGGALLIVEAFRIPSGSMIPALLIGDWLFVNKLRYGPHIPFTSVNLPGYAEPKRGEVVVFKSPPQIDQPEDPTPTLVKRLIGMPGDTIMMRDGMVYVNGIPQRQGFAASTNPVGDPDETNPLYEWQRQHELRNTRFGAPPATITHDNWGPLLIPPGRFMMLGDNRYNSKDSRYWGLVPRENVRGRPMFIYYSWNADDSDRPLPFITDIRWSRIGHRIR